MVLSSLMLRVSQMALVQRPPPSAVLAREPIARMGRADEIAGWIVRLAI